MFKHFIKTTFQNIYRNKSYVIINTIGLSVGIASLILITLFILHELSYDRFNEHGENIYRLVINAKLGERKFESAYTSPPFGKTLVRELDEVVESVRLDQWNDVIIHVNDKSFVENNFMLADSGFFRMFSIPLMFGDPDKALQKKYSVVLTRQTALKYFGNENVLGKKIKLNTENELFTVTGIVRDVPETCHFDFDLLASFSTHRFADFNNWLSNSVHTYILLQEGHSSSEVEKKIPNILRTYFSPQLQNVIGKDFSEVFGQENQYEINLQPLYDIHLNPRINHGFKQSNDKRYLYAFALVAFLIIVVAAINYTNLTIARGTVRAKEIGLKKVSGSSRTLIIFQFVFEAVVLSIIALGLAIFVVEFTIPYFNKIIQLNLSASYLKKWYVLPVLLFITVLVGIISGSYPAVYLSRFNPVHIFGSRLKPIMRGRIFQNSLVIVQYTISIIIISGTIISYNQTAYMLKKDLGFSKEQVLIIKRVETLLPDIDDFRKEIARIPGVVNASNSTSIPGFPNSDNGFLIEGRPTEKPFMMYVNWVDPYFKETYNLQLTSGRFFSSSSPGDSLSIIINEAAVGRFQLEGPLGSRFVLPGTQDTDDQYFNVLGVVRDFHFQSLHEEILPHAFMLKPAIFNWGGFISVKVDARNVASIVTKIEECWKGHAGNQPMQYSFLDEDFAGLYAEEKRTGKISLIFSVIAIVLASLGLYGLTTFKIEQRNKEISLRKVMGAELENIIFYLSKEIIVLIVIATAIAMPVTWFLMNKWLHQFYYHIHVKITDVMLSVIISLLIAVIAVGYKTYAAAKRFPADALRCE